MPIGIGLALVISSAVSAVGAGLSAIGAPRPGETAQDELIRGLRSRFRDARENRRRVNNTRLLTSNGVRFLASRGRSSASDPIKQARANIQQAINTPQGGEPNGRRQSSS